MEKKKENVNHIIQMETYEKYVHILMVRGMVSINIIIQIDQ